jgi:hypothetical protein
MSWLALEEQLRESCFGKVPTSMDVPLQDHSQIHLQVFPWNRCGYPNSLELWCVRLIARNSTHNGFQ